MEATVGLTFEASAVDQLSVQEGDELILESQDTAKGMCYVRRRDRDGAIPPDQLASGYVPTSHLQPKLPEEWRREVDERGTVYFVRTTDGHTQQSIPHLRLVLDAGDTSSVVSSDSFTTVAPSAVNSQVQNAGRIGLGLRPELVMPLAALREGGGPLPVGPLPSVGTSRPITEQEERVAGGDDGSVVGPDDSISNVGLSFHQPPRPALGDLGPEFGSSEVGCNINPASGASASSQPPPRGVAYTEQMQRAHAGGVMPPIGQIPEEPVGEEGADPGPLQPTRQPTPHPSVDAPLDDAHGPIPFFDVAADSQVYAPQFGLDSKERLHPLEHNPHVLLHRDDADASSQFKAASHDSNSYPEAWPDLPVTDQAVAGMSMIELALAASEDLGFDHVLSPPAARPSAVQALRTNPQYLNEDYGWVVARRY